MVDSRRYYQFQKSTGNPKHPYSKFGTGKCAPLNNNCSILFLIGLHSSFCALCSRQVPPNERSMLSIRKMRKIFQMIRGGCINQKKQLQILIIHTANLAQVEFKLVPLNEIKKPIALQKLVNYESWCLVMVACI